MYRSDELIPFDVDKWRQGWKAVGYCTRNNVWLEAILLIVNYEKENDASTLGQSLYTVRNTESGAYVVCKITKENCLAYTWTSYTLDKSYAIDKWHLLKNSEPKPIFWDVGTVPSLHKTKEVAEEQMKRLQKSSPNIPWRLYALMEVGDE